MSKKTNNDFQKNDECCNNCGSNIEHVQRVMKHYCESFNLEEPDIIIYEAYSEPVCTNCDEMSEVISKTEFSNRVSALMLKVDNNYRAKSKSI